MPNQPLKKPPVQTTIFSLMCTPLFLTIFLNICLLNETKAQDLKAEVIVNVNEKPDEIFGYEVGSEGIKKVENIEVKEVGPNKLQVTVPLSAVGNLAGALAVESGNDMRFGSFALPSSSQKKPLCDDKDLTYESLLGQQGALENLVGVRTQRRNLLKEKVALLLKNAPLERLMRLENGFGLPSVNPLSPSLSPEELLQRLYQLTASIRGYAYYQTRGKLADEKSE